MTTSEHQVAARQARKDERTKRIAEDLANMARDTLIREGFHAYLESEGYQRIETPEPGSCYKGSTQQMLWECYLGAVLTERAIKPTSSLTTGVA